MPFMAITPKIANATTIFVVIMVRIVVVIIIAIRIMVIAKGSGGILRQIGS